MSFGPRADALATLALGIALGSSCAARLPARPGGAATPDPSAIAAFQEATKSCAGIKTVTAELRLSGRVGDERLRGTLHAGLAAPAAVRFEAVAPFGAPVFILAGRNNRATLLFPRDNRVLADASVAEILDRMIGLALSADDLRRILTGCLGDSATATDGRSWPGGWRAVVLGSEVTGFLRNRAGATVVVAADYGAWRVDYADHSGGWPRTVRIRSAEPGRVDATARIEQLEINTAIEDRAFTLTVPGDAERITLQDLIAIAPLRGPS